MSLLYLPLLPRVFAPLMALADASKIAISALLIAPLGFAMGMPFPMAVKAAAARASPLVPRAWGVNACASVVAAVLATVLAIHLGFTVVVLLAVGLYFVTAATFPGISGQAEPGV